MTVTTEPITAGDRDWAAKMERIRARAEKPLTRVATLYDEDLVEAAEAAEIELGKAKALARKELDAEHASIKDDAKRLARVESLIPRDALVKERQGVYDTAVAESKEAEIKIGFKSIGSVAYEALINEHPPTDPQRKQGQSYNVDTFAPAIMAASSVDGMSEADAAEMLRTYSAGEANALFATATAVNESQSRIRLGKE